MTAEEFLLENNEKLLKGLSRLELNKLLIEFAKLHVEQALKIASEQVYHDIQIDWCDPYDYSAGHNGIKGDIDKESILNAYPLENIK